MPEVKELTNFYSAIKEDPRIGLTHISIYMALFQLYNLNGLLNPVYITSSLVMEVSKIRGLATYHRRIKELHEYGYIRYLPSYNPSISSQVHLLTL